MRMWMAWGLAALLMAPSPGYGAKTVWQEEGSNLSIFGDMRFRYETDHHEADGKPSEDRVRQQIRFRIGAGYKANETVSIGARMASAADDDHSTNHYLGILGGGTAESTFGLDQAYIKLDFKPGWFWVGKNENPSWDATQLTWDPDIQPEGAAIGVKTGDSVKAWAFAGYYILNATYYRAKDDTMTAYQAGVSFGEGFGIKAAVGGYSMHDKSDTGEGALAVPGGTASYNHAMLELNGKSLPLSPVLGAQYTTSSVNKEKYIGAGAKDSDRQATAVYLGFKPGPVTVTLTMWDVGYAGATALGALVGDEFATVSNYTGWDIKVGGVLFGALEAAARYEFQQVKNDSIKPTGGPSGSQGSAQLGKGDKRSRIRFDFSVKF